MLFVTESTTATSKKEKKMKKDKKGKKEKRQSLQIPFSISNATPVSPGQGSPFVSASAPVSPRKRTPSTPDEERMSSRRSPFIRSDIQQNSERSNANLDKVELATKLQSVVEDKPKEVSKPKKETDTTPKKKLSSRSSSMVRSLSNSTVSSISEVKLSPSVAATPALSPSIFSCRSVDHVTVFSPRSKGIGVCPICDKFFTLPIYLDCYHSMCLQCFRKIICTNDALFIFKNQPDTYKISGFCPLCGLPTKVSLPPSIASSTDLTQMVDKLLLNTRENKVMEAVSIYSSCRETKAIENSILSLKEELKKRQDEQAKCGFCEKATVTTECVQCEVFYCTSCSDILHLKPQFKKHVLIPIAAKERELSGHWNAYCTEHGDQKLTLYCTEDKCLVCPHCLLIGKHINHKCESFKIALENTKEKLKSFGVKLKDRAKHVEGTEEKLKEVEMRILQESKRIQTQTQEQFKALRQTLDQREAELLEVIRKEEKNKMAAVEDRKLDITKTKVAVEEQLALNDTLEVMPDRYFAEQILVDSTTTQVLQQKTLDPKIEADFHLMLEVEDQILALSRLELKDVNKSFKTPVNESAYLNHFELQQELPYKTGTSSPKPDHIHEFFDTSIIGTKTVPYVPFGKYFKE